MPLNIIDAPLNEQLFFEGCSLKSLKKQLSFLAVCSLSLHQFRLFRGPRLANVCILYRSDSKENLCAVITLSCRRPTTR